MQWQRSGVLNRYPSLRAAPANRKNRNPKCCMSRTQAHADHQHRLCFSHRLEKSEEENNFISLSVYLVHWMKNRYIHFMLMGSISTSLGWFGK
jgi:hypothetical protein